MRRECRERFVHYWLQWKPPVSDPGMHHGTCVTHVPWCMSGSLNPRWRGKRSRHSRRMRNPQFYVSGKRPMTSPAVLNSYDDVIKWKYFPRYWPFLWGIHRWPLNSPHKGQCRGALMFSLISALTNGWGNKWDAGDLIRHRAHFDVIVIIAIGLD